MMNGYTEFYCSNGELTVHTECYNVNARHYADYKLTKTATEKLRNALKTEDDLVKYLTKNYSSGIGIMDVLKRYEIQYTVVDRGYEDTSTDI